MCALLQVGASCSLGLNFHLAGFWQSKSTQVCQSLTLGAPLRAALRQLARSCGLQFQQPAVNYCFSAHIFPSEGMAVDELSLCVATVDGRITTQRCGCFLLIEIWRGTCKICTALGLLAGCHQDCQ